MEESLPKFCYSETGNQHNEKSEVPHSRKPLKDHLPSQNVGYAPNKNPKAEPFFDCEVAESEGDAFWPLSGRPYFSLVLLKSHVRPSCYLNVPTKMHSVLPSTTVPMNLSYRCKTWGLLYLGNANKKRFDQKWKTFVIDNDLKAGDACVFELVKSSNSSLEFKVQILRDNFPSELLARVDGRTTNSPIVIE